MKIKRKTLIYVMVMMLGLTGLTARAAMETEKTFLVSAPSSGKGAGSHETLPEERWPDSGIADVWASSEPGGADTWEQEAADGGFSPYPEPPSGSDPWTLSVPDPGMEGEADMELAGGPDTGYPAPSVMENEVLTTQTESDAAPLDEMPVLAGPVELNPALPGLIEDTQYGGSSGDEEEKPAIEIETQAQ